MSYDDLVTQGIIEYLDALEENDVFVALDEKDITAEFCAEFCQTYSTVLNSFL